MFLNNVKRKNKRFKKDYNIQSEPMESLKSDTQHTLERTTPTFNHTFASKARRSIGRRKVNMDVNDAIFKLPFDHGWKRELVYRTSDSVMTHRGRRKCNVYYCSPNNQKLRSLKEIQEQLNMSPTDNNPLTIESFTFLKRPIGINDESKELIRDVSIKLFEEESFVGIAIRPKKPKTLVQRPNNVFNNKSSKKMKVVFKYKKRSKKEKSKPIIFGNLEATSLPTSEYVTEDWQAVQSSAVLSESPSKTVDISNTGSNKKPKGPKEKTYIFNTDCYKNHQMLNEPFILLERLASEEVELLFKQNAVPSNINSQPKNVQKCLPGSSTGPVEKDVVTNNSLSPSENQQQSTLQVLSSNLNTIICDDHIDEKFLGKQKIGISLNDFTSMFSKELSVVVDDSYMVNSKSQHLQTQNSKVAIYCKSNSSSMSVQTSKVVNEQIVDELVLMTTKSALTEVIDKHTRKVTLDNQMTADKPDKQINLETFVHHDSSVLNLHTRTIFTTVPTPLEKSTVSAICAHSDCHNTTINIPRRRGRPPKNLTRIAEKKLPKKNICKHSEKTKATDSNAITKTDLASSEAERLQQQLINKSTGFDGNLSNEVDKLLPTDVASINECVGTDNRDLSLTSLQVDKNNEFIVSSIKKNNIRKKKQSTDIKEIIAEKCILISDNFRDPLMSTNNGSIQSKSTAKQNVADNVVEYGFECGRDIIEPYGQRIYYRDTYWSTNWEYSAAALTSHVKKKPSKVTLRKNPLINGVRAPLLKTTPTLKIIQSSDAPICGNSSKLTLSSSLVPVETSNGVRHLPALTTKRIGRPSAKRNKLLQAVIKSNSPRKSLHQHASALSAYMSNKALKTEIGTQQPGKLQDEKPKNSLDLDGPFMSTAMPNYDRKPEKRLNRRRMQSDHQRGTTKRRCGQCRSNTPSPPKLCAEQPFSQQDPINGVTVDHKTVKLRNKRVGLIKRRARDERVRRNDIFQQLHKVHKITEQNLRDLSSAVPQISDEEQESCNAIILPSDNQNSIWSSLTTDGNEEPDNMFVQIMYEQTGDKRFLHADLTDETLKMYREQRDLDLAGSVTNICGDYVPSNTGTDAILASNKRKKKRPNTTDWPKKKRRDIIVRTVDVNSDSDLNVIVKRQKDAERQRLKRQRMKLEQQKLNKEKSEVSVSLKATSKQLTDKKKKTTAYCRSTNLNDTPKNIKKVEGKKKYKIQKQQQQRILIKNKTVKVVPPVSGQKSCNKPKKSVGLWQRLKSGVLQQHQKETLLLSEQQKENVGQPTTTSGEFKCVTSTLNNGIKLLSSSSSSENVSGNTKLVRTKKSTDAHKSSSSTLESLPSAVVTVKGKLRKQQKSVTTSTVTWDAGRPKRYRRNRNTSENVEEEFRPFGSRPFEQHCPNVPSNRNTTVLKNSRHQKKNAIRV